MVHALGDEKENGGLVLVRTSRSTAAGGARTPCILLLSIRGVLLQRRRKVDGFIVMIEYIVVERRSPLSSARLITTKTDTTVILSLSR